MTCFWSLRGEIPGHSAHQHPDLQGFRLIVSLFAGTLLWHFWCLSSLAFFTQILWPLDSFLHKLWPGHFLLFVWGWLPDSPSSASFNPLSLTPIHSFLFFPPDTYNLVSVAASNWSESCLQLKFKNRWAWSIIDDVPVSTIWKHSY